MWHTGLVAPQHGGSSKTRDLTHVPCIGRRILNHCATGEVLMFLSISPSRDPSAAELLRDYRQTQVWVMTSWHTVSLLYRNNNFIFKNHFTLKNNFILVINKWIQNHNQTMTQQISTQAVFSDILNNKYLLNPYYYSEDRINDKVFQQRL